MATVKALKALCVSKIDHVSSNQKVIYVGVLHIGSKDGLHYKNQDKDQLYTQPPVTYVNISLGLL